MKKSADVSFFPSKGHKFFYGAMAFVLATLTVQFFRAHFWYLGAAGVASMIVMGIPSSVGALSYQFRMRVSVAAGVVLTAVKFWLIGF